MTSRKDSGRKSEQKVLAQHRALREQITALRESKDSKALLDQLRSFRGSLSEHFCVEEAAGGFYTSVILIAPRHQSVLDGLCTEHQELLQDTDELIARITDDGDDFGAVKKDAVHICERLEKHEAQENEILQEVMNTDIGVGD